MLGLKVSSHLVDEDNVKIKTEHCRSNGSNLYIDGSIFIYIYVTLLAAF